MHAYVRACVRTRTHALTSAHARAHTFTDAHGEALARSRADARACNCVRTQRFCSSNLHAMFADLANRRHTVALADTLSDETERQRRGDRRQSRGRRCVGNAYSDAALRNVTACCACRSVRCEFCSARLLASLPDEGEVLSLALTLTFALAEPHHLTPNLTQAFALSVTLVRLADQAALFLARLFLSAEGELEGSATHVVRCWDLRDNQVRSQLCASASFAIVCALCCESG
eukprot:6178201-Pleurochrysis_carterae.AAC.1